MQKPHELDSILIRSLLTNDRQRPLIISEDPQSLFVSKEGLDIGLAIREVVQEGGVIDVETVKAKSRVPSDIIDYIIANHQDISDRNVKGIIKSAKANVIESNILDLCQTKLLKVFSDPSKQTSYKLEYFFEETKKLSERLNNLGEGNETMPQLLDRYKQELKLREDGLAFKPSGDRRIDNILSYGWAPGDTTIIAGRPSHGKSLVGIHFAKLSANLKIPTYIFNFEMKNINTIDRLVSMIGGLPLAKIIKYFHQMTALEKERMSMSLDHIRTNMTLKMYDGKVLTLDEFEFAVKREQDLNGDPYMIVIMDLFTKMKDFSQVKNALEIEHLCNRTQERIKKLGVHFIPIVQVNREADKMQLRGLEDLPRIYPRFDQIKNSGALEEMADNIFMICRPSKYAHRFDWGEGLPDYIRLEVSKQRGGADTGFSDSLIYLTDNGVLALQTPPDDFNPLIGGLTS